MLFHKISVKEFVKMVKEDILLGLDMGRLEIEPHKISESRSQENDLESVKIISRNIHKKSFIQPKCCCPSRKRSNISICKRKTNKILKEPMLQILKCGNVNVVSSTENPDLQYDNILNSDTLNLCSLVQNCNQLKISSGSNNINTKEQTLSSEIKWWRNGISVAKEIKESRQNNTSSCSQQALNPPCDVTIDELASYFETLVHIPKKMSSMAEMMYI